uniref:DUF148 domain-containing protein n=1 Tax=Onchocerca volvulus TaxID=6282 RepID=A0A2K6WN95_ONCVO
MNVFVIASLLISCVIAQQHPRQLQSQKPEEKPPQKQQQQLEQQQQEQQQQQQQKQLQQLQQQQVQLFIPPFLIGAPPNVTNDFLQLLATAPYRTDKQMEETIERWVARQTITIQSAYKEFKKLALEALAKAEAQHQKIIANLSREAKTADARLIAVTKNSTLTGLQKQMQIQMIIDQLPDKVKEELQKAFQP